MDNKTLANEEIDVSDLIRELINKLLRQGASPCEISFELASHSVSVGIQFAPSAYHAFSVVSSGFQHASNVHVNKLSDRDNEKVSEPEVFVEKENSIVTPCETKNRLIH